MYVLNFSDECVIWSITPKSIIQELEKDLLEALKAREKGNLPKCARDQHS